MADCDVWGIRREGGPCCLITLVLWGCLVAFLFSLSSLLRVIPFEWVHSGRSHVWYMFLCWAKWSPPFSVSLWITSQAYLCRSIAFTILRTKVLTPRINFACTVVVNLLLCWVSKSDFLVEPNNIPNTILQLPFHDYQQKVIFWLAWARLLTRIWRIKFGGKSSRYNSRGNSRCNCHCVPLAGITMLVCALCFEANTAAINAWKIPVTSLKTPVVRVLWICGYRHADDA